MMGRFGKVCEYSDLAVTCIPGTYIMQCICCGTSLSDTTLICVSCGTNLSGDHQPSRKQVKKDAGQRSRNRLSAFGITVVIVTGMFLARGYWAGFSLGLLPMFLGWLAFAGFGFYRNWSFTNAFGGGFIAAMGVLSVLEPIDSGVEISTAEATAASQAIAKATASNPRAKTIQEWAATIRRNSTPEQVIQLIGRPSSTSETAADMDNGSKQRLIYEYPGLAIDQRRGRLETLRIEFSSGSARMVQEGNSGLRLELPM